MYVPPIVKNVGFKVVLPLSLLAAATIRPCFLSIGYVVLALISAVLPAVRPNVPLPKVVGTFVLIASLYSLGVGLAVTTYQISEKVSHQNESAYICDRSDTTLFRSIGLVRFHGGDGFESSRSILPEILAFVMSFVTLVIVLFWSHRESNLDVVGDVSIVAVRTENPDESKRTASGGDRNELLWKAVANSLRRLTNFVIVLFTAYAGIVQPSVTNSVYFLAFLFISTWWATYKPLRHGVYNKIKKFLIFYAGVHFCVVYTYQIPIVHNLWIQPKSIIPRLFGLTVLMDSSCPQWWKFPFIAADFDESGLMHKWPLYANPIVILVYFYFMVAQYKFTRNGSRQYTDDADAGSSVHEELLSQSRNDESSSTPHSPAAGETPNSIPLRKVTSQAVDRSKLSNIFNAPGEQESATSQGMIAVITFVIFHSYSLALATMMTWALLYHSIFGLILLIGTCALWIFKNTRNVSFALSPIIIAYIEFLLLLQYVLSMDVHREIGDPKWMQFVGISWAKDPLQAMVILCVQTLLSLPVFLLLRLSRRERYYESLSDFERQRRINSYGTFGSSRAGYAALPSSRQHKGRRVASFLESVSSKLSVYFVFVVSLTLLLVATFFKPTFYTIGFFAIWALNILYLKVSFRLYRGVAYVFWLSLTFYTSLVIIALYIYQFKGFSSWLQQTTRLPKIWFDAIGLVDYSAIGESGALFLRLFSPICLFVVTMLQLKFFHDPWCRAVTPTRDATGTDATATTSASIGDTLAKKLKKFGQDVVEFLWRFMEVHISKIVFVVIAIFVANHIAALYIPLVVLLSLAIALPSAADGIFSILMCSYLFLVAIGKMIYQLDVIPELSKIDRGVGAENCTYNETMAEWFGLIKEKDATPFYMLSGVLVSVVALAFQSIVIYRQRHHRVLHGLPESTKTKVFPDFHITHYDRSINHAFKFVCDYAFYKFGYEICIVAMGIDAWVRMDSLGAIQCLWIIVFALNKRAFTRRLWPVFVVYMSILYPLQFVLYVGLPPDSCIPYPWTNLLPAFPKEANHNLGVLLGLSTYGEHWPASYLVIDFFLLLLSSCQLHVFRKEGEDNDSIYNDGEYVIKPDNPKYDFIDIKKSSIDYLKTLMFHYGHWLTLIATLAAGIAGTSFFALGYIVLTLWLLWQGNNLYVMNSRAHSFRTTLARWNLILAYTLFTITMKVLLQIFGCVFLSIFDSPDPKWSHVLCIVRQLFSVTCVNGLAQQLPDMGDFEKRCAVEPKEAQIGYDVIALAFLVFQIRAFHSWYFQHCMVEYRCEVILANRGCVLKNQLVEKEMKEQNEQQKAKFNDIRRRTEAIRERYHKQIERGAVMAMEPKTYGQAKRAGDYYMFKYDPENDDLVEPVESFVPEMDPKATEYNRLHPGQLMYAATAHDMDLAKTLEQVKKGDMIKDPEDRALTAVMDTEKALEEKPTQSDRDQAGADETAGGEASTATALEPTKESKAESLFLFAQKVLSSAFDMCSVMLNKMCREHRYVGYVLNKEKGKLKYQHAESLSNTSRKLTDLRSDVDLSQLQLVNTAMDVDKMETEAKSDWLQRSSFMRLVNASVNCVGAHTDVLCYLFSIMTQVMTGGLLTMPLPLMSLFWGNLSNPRPSKFFWVTMITYTEFVIVVKFVCQFSFFPFNSTEFISQEGLNPTSLDKLFGISKRDRFALWDIILLFALFFHRYMLRKLGLWKDANLTDTFLKILDDNESNPPSRAASGSDASNPDVVIPPSALSGEENGPTSSDVVTAIEAEQAEEKRGPIGRFIYQLFHPKFRYIRDLYPIMFGLDVICFLIMTIGYASFGEGGSGNVLADVQASRIPITLVVMLVGMTLAIIVDRALYLRKSVLGKLIYQIILITFLHIWVFLLLPDMTRRSAITNHTAQALYVIKSCYFLVSAWQIRNGYPKLCIGNLLTHYYGMANMVAFKVFMNIPFLFELRTTIDWTWTDTSMPLFDFFNMENFYAHIFNIKCARSFEAAYPAPRGIAKGKLVKYMMGFPIIIGVVVLIWSPLILWSLLNQIGEISMPVKVTMQVSIEGFPPLYEMEAQGQFDPNKRNTNNELQTIDSDSLKKLTQAFTSRYDVKDTDSILRSRNAISYMKGYTADDILIVRFRPESQVYWPISKESISAMVDKLKSTDTAVNFEVKLEFTRPFDKGENAALKHSKSFFIAVGNNQTMRDEIADALNERSTNPILIPRAIPAYIQVPNQGELILPSPIGTSIMMNGQKPNQKVDVTGLEGDEAKKAWFDTLRLNLTVGPSPLERMWVADLEHPTSSDDVWLPTEKTPYSQVPYVQVVGFVDRAFPSLLAKVFKGGVIAMYVSVVVVLGRGIVRGLFATSPSSVMFNEIPNPDHLLKICLDIYLVREAKDFVLEQDLFAKLIFLFRSPATLIEWTRAGKKKMD